MVYTANILGIFNDPFEFAGDYGPIVNPVREQVFKLVVSPVALAQNLSDIEIKKIMGTYNTCIQELHTFRDSLIAQAIKNERGYGPTLSQLISPSMLSIIYCKRGELQDCGFSESAWMDILGFIEKYKDQKIFRFLRNNPPQLLSLDKSLRDQAAREGRVFEMPILGSTHYLQGYDSQELKKNLIEAVFTKGSFALTKSAQNLCRALDSFDKDYLRGYLGEGALNSDLRVFTTPLGQIFFYWMYQSLNLELIAQRPALIEQVNTVKAIFANTLGNPVARAKAFKEKLLASHSKVLFTQESDALMPKTLIEDDSFLPIDKQNMQDGTFVFLCSNTWNTDYEIISIDGYEGYEKGRINAVLATMKGTSQKFLLASCHGDSNDAADGRLQISHIMDKFHALNDGNLQLIIGIDANTKAEEEVQQFRNHLDNLGLVATTTGPTTVKKRMVSAQHSKVGRFACDEEDYLITLKPENGGKVLLDHVTVGFKVGRADVNRPLPNIDNPSDHYAIGASLLPINNEENCDTTKSHHNKL